MLVQVKTIKQKYEKLDEKKQLTRQRMLEERWSEGRIQEMRGDQKGQLSVRGRPRK